MSREVSTPRRPESHPSTDVRLVTPPQVSIKTSRCGESIGETPVHARGRPRGRWGRTPGLTIRLDGHADRRAPGRSTTPRPLVVPAACLHCHPPLTPAGLLSSRPRLLAALVAMFVGLATAALVSKGALLLTWDEPIQRAVEGSRTGLADRRVPPHLVPRLDEGGPHLGCRPRRHRLASLSRRRVSSCCWPSSAGRCWSSPSRPPSTATVRTWAPRGRQRPLVPERSRDGRRRPVGVGAAGRRPVLERSAGLVGVGRARRRR